MLFEQQTVAYYVCFSFTPHGLYRYYNIMDVQKETKYVYFNYFVVLLELFKGE